MRAIIFDLDGTLLDTKEDILAAFAKAFAGLGLPMPPSESLIAVIGRRLEDCFAAFLDGDAARSAEGARLFRSWYAGHYRDRTRPYPGVQEALQALARKLPLAVCTMKKGPYARELVDSFGWSPLFRCVLGSEEGFPPKPDPGMLEEVCRRLAVEPGQALYVGDTSLDALMARRAGAPFAFAAYGYGSLGGQPALRLLSSPGELAELGAS
jgi:phosphoglycolate phosphatase